ncbi:MAG TPA: extracellular solute-binding protein [Chloroflexota bacterium]|nr:extracellular solute-binding protein [Chloroflexota bacterium]
MKPIVRPMVSRRAVLRGAGASLAAGLLGACARAGGGQAPTEAGKTTTVNYMIYAGEEERKAWEATKAGFERAHPDLKLDITYAPINDPGFNYDEKLRAMMAAGNAPDTVRVALRAYAADGALLELDRYVQQDKSFESADNLPGVLDAGRWNGKLYLLVGKLGPQILYYNVRKFQETGTPLPREQAERGAWNFDAFVQAAEKLTNRQETPPRQIAYGPYTSFWSWIAQGGGQPFNADYTEGYLDRAQNFDPAQFRADLVVKRDVAVRPDDPQTHKSWQGFADGYVAMFISGPWQMARIHGRLSDPWDIAPTPLQPNGKPQMNTGGEGVWKGSKVPEAAYRWVAFMEGKEGQRLWSGLGTDLPGRRSVLTEFAEGKLFADPKLAPPNNKLWLDIVPRSEKTHLLTKEANDVYSAAWQAVESGKTTAREAFTEANRQAAPFLKPR